MDSEELKLERARFAKVVTARKTNKELLELFNKLDSSVVFAAAAKPYLFGDLIEACVRRVPARLTIELLDVVEQSGAARLIRAVNSEPEADEILRGLVKKAFEAVPKEESTLMEVFTRLERSGMSQDRGHTVDLMWKAGMSENDMGDICDLTFHAYYPSYARRRDEATV